MASLEDWWHGIPRDLRGAGPGNECARPHELPRLALNRRRVAHMWHAVRLGESLVRTAVSIHPEPSRGTAWYDWVSCCHDTSEASAS
jgi:hypothetical protein